VTRAEDGVISGLSVPIKIGTQVGEVTQIDTTRDLLLIDWGRTERDDRPLTAIQWMESKIHNRTGVQVPREVQEICIFDKRFHDHLAYHLMEEAKDALEGFPTKSLVGRGGMIEQTTLAWKLIDYAQRTMRMGDRRMTPVSGT
jgi:hypothetical protein